MTDIQHLPEDSKTRVGVILLQLRHTVPTWEKNPHAQFLWGLAIVKTIEECLLWEEDDIRRETETVFKRIRNELNANFDTHNRYVYDDIASYLALITEKACGVYATNKVSLLEEFCDFTQKSSCTRQLHASLDMELLRTEKATKEHEASLQESKEVQAFEHVFQEKFREAMVSMISSPQYISALACFQAAYEYRRSLPWLAESRDTRDVIGQDGLSYALRAALTCYTIRSQEALEYETKLSPIVAEFYQRGVDPAWASRLLDAISATIKERFGLERFENHLLREKVDSSPDILRKHIAAALINYYRRREMSIFPDSF